ncbi:MAG: hypothetical protein ACK5TK_00695 [Betaproteobacteria bacterium]
MNACMIPRRNGLFAATGGNAAARLVSAVRAAPAAVVATALAVASLLYAPAQAAAAAEGQVAAALPTDVLGYAAAALVFVTFYLRSIVHIRLAAVCSNLLFIGYASSAELAPILVLHAMLLPLNLWRLRELAAGRQAGGTVPAGGPGQAGWRALLARLRGAGPTTSAGTRAAGMGSGMAALDPARTTGEDGRVAGWLRASAAVGAAVVLLGLTMMPADLEQSGRPGERPVAAQAAPTLQPAVERVLRHAEPRAGAAQ